MIQINKIRITIIAATMLVMIYHNGIAHSTTTGLCNLLKDINPQTSYNCILISEVNDISACASWKLFRVADTQFNFQNLVENKEEGAFYYFDETLNHLIIQKYLPEKQMLIRRIFQVEKHFFEITLLSCSTNLKANKVKLESIYRYLKNGGIYSAALDIIDEIRLNSMEYGIVFRKEIE